MGGGGSSEEQRGYGSLPWWAEGAHRSLINKAEEFAYGDRGKYVAYGDERIAGFTDEELTAQDARRTLYEQGDPSSAFSSNQLGLAAGNSSAMADYATRQFDTGEAGRRMNPYLENVLNPQLRETQQSFDRDLQRSQADNIARGGAFGSYRSGVMDNQLRSDKALALADIRGKGQFDAYNAGRDEFYRDRDSAISGLGASTQSAMGLAGASSQLGSEAQQRSLTNISELDRAGAVQREMQQKEMDLAYGDFAEERDYPMRRMQFLSSILTGVPNAQLSGTTSVQSGPGLPSQLAALGLGAAGASQIFGGNGQ